MRRPTGEPKAKTKGERSKSRARSKKESANKQFEEAGGDLMNRGEEWPRGTCLERV